MPLLGASFDVGVPDGAQAALVLKPIRPLRVHAGIGTNGIARGYRAGITLIPLATWISPTVSVDVGRFREGDATPIARIASGDATLDAPALERVGYRYANLHVGLEFGRDRSTFFIHAGVSRISGRLHDLGSEMDTAGSNADYSVTLSDPAVTITTVSARVGWILYFR